MQHTALLCLHCLLCSFWLDVAGHSIASSSGRNSWIVLERKSTHHVSSELLPLNHRFMRQSGAGFLPLAFCPLECLRFRNIVWSITSNKKPAASSAEDYEHSFTPFLSDLRNVALWCKPRGAFGASSISVCRSGDCSNSSLTSIPPPRGVKVMFMNADNKWEQFLSCLYVCSLIFNSMQKKKYP